MYFIIENLLFKEKYITRKDKDIMVSLILTIILTSKLS